MDPDPEGDKEGEARVGGNKGIGNADDDKEETPRGPSSPFPLRRRRRSPGLLPPLLLEMMFDQYNIHISSYKQLNIKMTIINSQPLFIKFLSSAAQR